ncbi:hypothetical protein SAMD00019534_005380 [Acytostelium subglobosum LB1]|uniref:hypothetical protein n=1 Tax=Acytostelium subglobosum LB1 TaxID=1410327 RepID=UPI000644E2DD|nr:hypothetical protein SAMD00019534_005380 [Acytostelium subglobosum LB1]GAM17363.1 hypothetical protein SAMD00019534_005380 [Acytostelium subglobosum LB1]|eukprot:XP_012759425.1 hypothetical protein SAMD00019534_005380 [Acytostelium subglobosum LB1]
MNTQDQQRQQEQHQQQHQQHQQQQQQQQQKQYDTLLTNLMQEFEREGLKVNQRVSRSHATLTSTSGSQGGTPTSTTPLQGSSLLSSYDPNTAGGASPSLLSLSTSLLSPQTSPWILGYAMDDMGTHDELAILPMYLVPLHPFVDPTALGLLLHYFRPLTHLAPTASTVEASILLSKAIHSFSNKHRLFDRLSLNIEQLVWIIYLFVDYHHQSLNQTMTPIALSPPMLSSSFGEPNTTNSSSISISSSSSLSSSTTPSTRKAHFEIIDRLLALQTPFTNNDDDLCHTLLSKLNASSTYNDLSQAFISKSDSLNLLLEWTLELVGLGSKYRRTLSNESPLLEHVNQLVYRLKTVLYRSYNLVKVGAIVPYLVDQAPAFNGFLPIPHHMLHSIVHVQRQPQQAQTLMQAKSRRHHVRYDSQSPALNNLFAHACSMMAMGGMTPGSTPATPSTVPELCAVLKKRLYKDSAIHLDNVEVITMDEFNRRREQYQQQQQQSTLRQSNVEEYDEAEMASFDLIANEDLMLFYGYTLDDYDYVSIDVQVYKTLEQLEQLVQDDSEMERERLLQAAKISILKELGVGAASIRDGNYIEMLTRDKPLGINLLEITRVAKLRETEAYFYESGQCATMISQRNELEVLVSTSQTIHRILDGISSFLQNVFLSVNGEGSMQLPTELERYYKNHQSILERSLQQIIQHKNNHCRLANKTVQFVRPLDSIYKKFERWLVEGGVLFPKLQIANFSDGTGRGLVTAKKVEENECVISVPRRFLINVQVARQHEVLGKIFEDFSGLNDDTILFLFVIYEKENPNSFWRPFFDTLPSYFPTSIHFTPTELLELEGTNLFAETIHVKEHLQSIRDMLFPELSEQYPTIFPESLFSWENFLWARSLFDSRAIQLKIDGKIMNCLVPMADMVNHHVTAQISQRHFDQEADAFKMISCCSIGPSAQIYLHYGALQNWELSLYYGFVIPNNSYESFHIGFDLPDDEDGGHTTQAKKQVLADNLLSIDTHYLRRDGIPKKVLAALRVALMTPEELNPHVDIWNPISRRNEEAVLHTLYSTALMLLKQFTSTWEEDKQLCEQMSSDNPQPMLIARAGVHDGDDHEDSDDEEEHEHQSTEQMKIVLQYRIDQKLILTSTLEKVTEIMNAMDIEVPKSPSDFSDDEHDGDMYEHHDDDEYYSDDNEEDDDDGSTGDNM